MRRIIALPGIVVASLALAACGPGSLDADPPAASGTPEPSASPSASPEPTPEGERFDDVDLAAALVPLPFTPPQPELWGEWTTTTLTEVFAGLDSAAFASAPECVAAVDVLDAVVPEEIVAGGYPYEGTLIASIRVARMASPDEASALVAAIDAAAAACDGVEGTAVEQHGITAMRGLLSPSTVIGAAGYGFVAVGNDGSNHYYGEIGGAHDELVLMTSSDMMMQGWDEAVVADIQTQIAALDAAVGD